MNEIAQMKETEKTVQAVAAAEAKDEIEILNAVRHGRNLRCRDEGEGNFLIYCPETDEMHIIGAVEKKIFDLCAQGSIDDVLAQAIPLLVGTDSDAGDQEVQDGAREILTFVQRLIVRRIVVADDECSQGAS